MCVNGCQTYWRSRRCSSAVVIVSRDASWPQLRWRSSRAEKTRNMATGLSEHLPLENFSGVGPAKAAALAKLGVVTPHDLVEYFPSRYELELSERPISELIEGPTQNVRGEVLAVDYIAARPRARFEATLQDDTGRLSAVWFNGSYLRRSIHPGMTLQLKGKVKFYRGIPSMANPKHRIVETETPTIDPSRYKPIYPASSALKSDAIAKIIRDSLERLLEDVHEWFDDDLLKRRQLMPRRQAYRLMHTPNGEREAAAARRRLVYDELMLVQLGFGLSRRIRDGRFSAPVLRLDKTLDERIRARFPFEMTDDQLRAAYDISRDLRSGRAMNRLLQGDVGSGKTIVAAHAMLTAVANKMQAAMLAPTEVLAEQHFLTLNKLLSGSNVRLELFTGRSKRAKDKAAKLRTLADGDVHIAVGTQALIQQDIEFANLGLIVIDEQHKLGVQQRKVLKDKGLSPHYLVMTATPIPRTLALSYFADFDVSTIEHLPPGRQPIVTKWVRSNLANEAYNFVRKQVQGGRQAYVVVPQIDANDGTDVASLMAVAERLKNGPLAGLRLGTLHGRMPAEERDAVMLAFRDRQLDVLLATTVIEVGIDVPNSTTIVIESAERFGLSQLHQLRGRVGRGEHASTCILISDAETPDAVARLEAMVQTTSGFEISEMDLQLRGPGQFFGTAQHGLPELKLADISQEMELLKVARDDATQLLDQDPQLEQPVYRHLRKALIDRFGDSIPLAQVG
ncbi:MAG: ATP-dependent DNA helicase RecG [Tepidisphaeraceae bacterium]